MKIKLLFSALFYLLIFLFNFSSTFAQSTVEIKEGAKLLTDTASFIMGADFSFSRVEVKPTEIVLDGHSLSATSTGANPNITITKFFQESQTVFNVEGETGSYVTINLYTDSYAEPLTVEVDDTALTKDTDWWWFSSNLTVKINVALSVKEVKLTFVSEYNPIGYWKFDEGSDINAADDSPFENDGTLGDGTCSPGSGACPSWVSDCHSGYCLNFDGVDDYVEVQNSLSLNSTEEITVIAWIKAPPQQTNAWPRIACKMNWTESGWCFLAKNDTNVLRWEIYTPEHIVINGVTDILNNQWHHVAGTYDKKNLTIYVDGEFEANLTENADMINNDLNLTIGSSEIRWFNGIIDEVKIYSKALSAEEIKNEYLYGIPTTTPTTISEGEGEGEGEGPGTTTLPLEEPKLTFSMPASLKIYQNETKDFKIKVTNPGTKTLHNIAIDIIGIPKTSYSITPNLVDLLDASQSTYFTVSINTQDIEPGSYTLTLNITSKETFEETTMTLKVEEIIPGVTTTTIETTIPPEEEEKIVARANVIKILIIVAVIIGMVMVVVYYIIQKKAKQISRQID